MGKGLVLVLLTLFASLLVSCEDPGLIDFNQRKNNLQTVFVDTFTVVTSTVLLDSIPTSNTNTLLVGKYSDNLTGVVSASTYFQVGYLSTFLPDPTSIYDSIGLVLPYTDYSYGDTTKSITLNVYELTQLISLRNQPVFVGSEKLSPFKPSSALYNTSQVGYSATPLASTTVRYYPHRDSLYIPLPKQLGQKWYDIEKIVPDVVRNQSSQVKVNWFSSDYFKGIHIAATGSNASIAAFRAAKVKVRLFYRQLVEDNINGGRVLKNARFDFPLVNGALQFNNISSDRSASPLSSLVKLKPLSSLSTGNSSYIQSGIGMFTKLEFPSLKGFLKNKNVILVEAILEVNAVQRTYLDYTRAPNSLSIYSTDQSNLVLGGISSRNGVLSAPISYDFEYGLNTKYSFSLTDFVSSEITTEAIGITPLALISPAVAAEANRLVVGNKFHPTNKIKLKIYYSQYATNQ